MAARLLVNTGSNGANRRLSLFVCFLQLSVLATVCVILRNTRAIRDYSNFAVERLVLLLPTHRDLGHSRLYPNHPTIGRYIAWATDSAILPGPGCDLRSGHVRFVVDKVALGQGFRFPLPILTTRGSVVDWGTILQAGRSQVQFPMMSLDFSIDLIRPASIWPWDRLSL
jgi:hypothetical protein